MKENIKYETLKMESMITNIPYSIIFTPMLIIYFFWSGTQLDYFFQNRKKIIFYEGELLSRGHKR